MTNLPDPLTPPDCDLRGLEWMPLYGDRLFSSDTWLLASPEGRGVALMLWWAAWKQKPAGSLADQDRALAQLAGYGANQKGWLAIKEEAMRGWLLCSDGRLYHPVVCEFALQAWDRRKKERTRKSAYRSKLDGTIKGQDATVPKPADKISAGHPTGQDGDRDWDRDGDGHVERRGEERRKKESPFVGSPTKAEADEEFKQFWLLYPRKAEGPGDARKPWESARKVAAFGEIMQGLRRYPFNPEFLPMAATWLNKRRWLTQTNTVPPNVVGGTLFDPSAPSKMSGALV